MSDQTVLLTGCTGYLGARVAKTLLRDGCSVIGLIRPTSNLSRLVDLLPRMDLWTHGRDNLEGAMRERNITTILHCATDYGRTGSDTAEVMNANFYFPAELLELAKKIGDAHFINVDTILNGDVSIYAHSKEKFREYLRNRGAHLPVTNVVLNHFYGPKEGKETFVSSMIRKLLCSEKFIDLTPGLQERDFTYIDDVVSAFSIILRQDSPADSTWNEFTIGTGHPITIRRFLETLKELVGHSSTEFRFGVLKYRDNERMTFASDLKSIKKLGWSPLVSLEEGLAATIASVKKEMDQEAI